MGNKSNEAKVPHRRIRFDDRSIQSLIHVHTSSEREKLIRTHLNFYKYSLYISLHIQLAVSNWLTIKYRERRASECKMGCLTG
jgi:hypothetical protein